MTIILNTPKVDYCTHGNCSLPTVVGSKYCEDHKRQERAKIQGIIQRCKERGK